MTLKTIAKGAFLICSLVCLLVVIVVFQINSLEKTGEVFIASLQSKETKLAYNLLSNDLQNELTYEGFRSHVENYSFDRDGKISWADRYRENEVGFVSGHLTNENEQSTHFDFILGQDEDDWRIYALNLTGLDKNNQGTEIGVQKELESRIPLDLRIFLSAVRNDDLIFFYKNFAEAFQQQYSEAEFINLYGPFKGYADEISDLLETQVFIEKYDKEQGDLVHAIDGYYFNKMYKYSFTIKYLREGEVFKIVGFNVSLDGRK